MPIRQLRLTTCILELEWREKRGSRRARFSTREAQTTCSHSRGRGGTSEAKDRLSERGKGEAGSGGNARRGSGAKGAPNREELDRSLRARGFFASQARVSRCAH